jgi:hypothetical protein
MSAKVQDRKATARLLTAHLGAPSVDWKIRTLRWPCPHCQAPGWLPLVLGNTGWLCCEAAGCSHEDVLAALAEQDITADRDWWRDTALEAIQIARDLATKSGAPVRLDDLAEAA